MESKLEKVDRSRENFRLGIQKFMEMLGFEVGGMNGYIFIIISTYPPMLKILSNV